jgi:hypothetical protein
MLRVYVVDREYTTRNTNLCLTMESHTSTSTSITIVDESPPTPITSTFDNDFVFQHILSFVGDKQYRFVAGVNRHFHKTYTLIYPNKTTSRREWMKCAFTWYTKHGRHFCSKWVPVDTQPFSKSCLPKSHLLH